VIRALGPHARGGDPPEFEVENLDQLAGGLVIAVPKSPPSAGLRYRVEEQLIPSLCHPV
jgi:hypothetical protein